MLEEEKPQARGREREQIERLFDEKDDKGQDC